MTLSIQKILQISLLSVFFITCSKFFTYRYAMYMMMLAKMLLYRRGIFFQFLYITMCKQ